ncbi:hypothetical protein HOA92_04585 [archaeon]|jgi:nitroreductase|nr:hypothetical protein [archaeon]MBT6762293.1 hypothetical protein [archaeon]
MHDIIDIIKERRTTEDFLPKYVDWDKISKIIDAGRHAPSSGNIQNWKFIVVNSPDKKRGLAEAAFGQHKITLASSLIVVCGEEDKGERYYGLRGARLYTIQNCAAAVQNMLLEATSLGLGSKWIGAFDEDKVREICSIPAEVRPQAIVAFGYAKSIPPKPPKYPLESLVYLEKWRSKLRNPNRYLKNYSAILKGNVEEIKTVMQKTATLVKEKAAPKAKSITEKLREKLTRKKE